MIAVERAAASIAAWATRDMGVVENSTVPLQTAVWVQLVLVRTVVHHFDAASNPEFLREGMAVGDSFRPGRILVGADSEPAHSILREFYAPIVDSGARYFATDVPTAELAKPACNGFLSLKVSFANGLGGDCEVAGADLVAIADIMGADPRIGRAFLNAGLGYGGFCFPKDLGAFRVQAQRLGYEFTLLDEVVKLNEQALEATVDKVRGALWNLENKRIALFELAFMPGTDDIRDSPALRLAQRLLELAAQVVGFDPAAAQLAAAAVRELETSTDPYATVTGAHCTVIAADWHEYASLDLERVKNAMAMPRILDPRNVLDPEAVRRAGLAHYPTGRLPVKI